MTKKAREPIYYSDYLQLDKLLSSQSPKSVEYGQPAHDETLFIIVHQAYELWFKQIIHELDAIIGLFKKEYVDEEHIGITVSLLRRITEIQKVILEQFRVIETMTPLDFLEFRDFLLPASGFQSFQFRIIENKLGLKPGARLKYNRVSYYKPLSEAHQEIVKRSEEEPSLFILIEKWLERTPFLIFDDFNFLDNYKDAVEQMLNSDKEIILNNPTMTDD
jgi:tryptophan 2,3-dioxygenase